MKVEQPIRVLHMIGSLNIGGSQTMVINLYNNIDRAKVQFDFVIDKPNENYYVAELEHKGARVYTMPAFNGANLMSVRKAWHNFFEEHPEYKILHSHVRSYASVYIPIAKKHGLKTIIHSHNTSNGRGIKVAVKKIMQYPLRYQADGFFGCSKEAGRWLFGKKIVKNKFHLLKNAIESDKFAYNESIRKKVRCELNLTDECLVVGTVGRMVQQKNPFFTIELCERLKKVITDKRPLKFLWVGDGELYEEVERQVKEKELQDIVVLLGARSDVEKWLQAMDIFVMPSQFEGLGIVAIEAQASGLPTLCSDVVPREVKVTELCEFLPLSEIDQWVMKIINNEYENRKNTSDYIIESGYDIKTTAEWLQKYYLDSMKSMR